MPKYVESSTEVQDSTVLGEVLAGLSSTANTQPQPLYSVMLVLEL